VTASGTGRPKLTTASSRRRERVCCRRKRSSAAQAQHVGRPRLTPALLQRRCIAVTFWQPLRKRLIPSNGEVDRRGHTGSGVAPCAPTSPAQPLRDHRPITRRRPRAATRSGSRGVTSGRYTLLPDIARPTRPRGEVAGHGRDSPRLDIKLAGWLLLPSRAVQRYSASVLEITRPDVRSARP